MPDGGIAGAALREKHQREVLILRLIQARLLFLALAKVQEQSGATGRDEIDSVMAL